MHGLQLRRDRSDLEGGGVERVEANVPVSNSSRSACSTIELRPISRHVEMRPGASP